MTDMQALDLDVTIERERARRLVDRFGGKDAEGGELARERHAHRVSAAFRKEMGERLNTLLVGASRSGGPSGAIACLDAALDERWRRLRKLSFSEAYSGSRSAATPTRAVEAPAMDVGVEQMRRKLAEKRRLLEGDLLEEDSRKPPHDYAAEVPPGIVERSVSAFEALKDTLDDISVKSVLDFRSAGAGNLAAEAVATAAACTIANIDDTVRLQILSLNPDCPWEESLQILSKPGHFINSLRRYPYAVDSGKVPEDNVMGARHFLAMADDLGSDDLHPAVRNLRRWVDSAVAYWDSANEDDLGDQDVDAEFEAAEAAAEAEVLRRATSHVPVPTPVRASASGAMSRGGQPAPKSVPTSFQPSTRDGPLVKGTGTSASSTSRPRSAKRPEDRPAPGPRLAPGAANSKSTVPKSRPSASPRSRPGASSTPVPGTGAGPGGSFSGTSRPAASPQAQRSSLHKPGAGNAASPGVRPSTHSASSPASATTPSSTLRPAASPHPRQGAGPSGGPSTQRVAASPGPRAGSTNMVATSATPQSRNSLPSKSGRSPMRPATATRTTGSTSNVSATSPSRPNASPRRTTSPRRGAASPRRAAPQALSPGGLSTSKSAGMLGQQNRFSTGGNTGATVTTLANRGTGASNQVATSAPGPKLGGMPPAPVQQQSVQSIQEWRKMLEETKKEVREIKAIESQMRWNLQREEKKQRIDEEKEDIEEIRDWRWKESDDMKAFVAEKEQQIKATDLEASKDFQEFKREVKVIGKEEEKKAITEQYLQDLEIAQWRAAQAKVEREQEKEVALDAREDLYELKEVKVLQKEQEKLEDYENRVFEQNLEMANLQREIAKEKEQMLHSLELTRQAQRVPLRDGRSMGGRTAGRRSP